MYFVNLFIINELTTKRTNDGICPVWSHSLHTLFLGCGTTRKNALLFVLKYLTRCNIYYEKRSDFWKNGQI